jgi:hypothetical protein
MPKISSSLGQSRNGPAVLLRFRFVHAALVFIMLDYCWSEYCCKRLWDGLNIYGIKDGTCKLKVACYQRHAMKLATQDRWGMSFTLLVICSFLVSIRVYSKVRTHLWNVGRLQRDYTAQHPRWQPSSYLSPLGPVISPSIYSFIISLIPKLDFTLLLLYKAAGPPINCILLSKQHFICS